MKPLLPLLFAVALVPATPRLAGAAEPLTPGSWSAQFSVQPNFTLGSFQGSVLSLKRHLGGDRAMRFGFSFGISRRNDDESLSFTDPTFGSAQTLGDDGNNWSIGLTSAYLWYSSVAAPVHVYWGAGPFVGLSGSGTDRLVTLSTSTPTTDSVTTRFESDGWQVGLAGALGIEWLVAKRMGLFAEYGSSLAYNSFSESRTSVYSQIPRTEKSTREARRVEFGGSGARLGLSAYF